VRRPQQARARISESGCVCVCVCVRERERERERGGGGGGERETKKEGILFSYDLALVNSPFRAIGVQISRATLTIVRVATASG
jgi:hypothetical protein